MLAIFVHWLHRNCHVVSQGTNSGQNGKANRLFPSCFKPLIQSEAKVVAIDITRIFYFHANITHFHKKGFAPSLVLKVIVFGTRKWSIKVNAIKRWILHEPLSDVNENRIRLHDKFVCIVRGHVVVNLKLSGKSLISNRNRSGPKMDPWGNLQVIIFSDESWPLIIDCRSLFVRYDLSQFNLIPKIPNVYWLSGYSV